MTLIENVLTEQAKHKVRLLKPVRGEKKKWLNMATTSAKQSLVAHIFTKTNMQERAMALQQALGLAIISQIELNVLISVIAWVKQRLLLCGV